MNAITAVSMPRWGLSMQEGTLVQWWKQVGDEVAEGDDLADIETSKITNVAQSPSSGILRRIVAAPGETLPCGALIGVLADAAVPEDQIDSFVDEFRAKFVPSGAADGQEDVLSLSIVDAAGEPIRVGRAGDGDGTPVVLLHGFAADINSWLFNLDAFGADRPVIAVELPGHGASTKNVGDGSLAALASRIAAALDALGVANAHLVGHSLGGAVALRLAADRPGLAKSITLICPVGLPGTKVAQDFLDGIIEARRARDLRPWLEMLVADPSRVTREMVDDVLKFKRLDGVDEALRVLRDHIAEGTDFAAMQRDARDLTVRVLASRTDRIAGAPDETRLPAGYQVTWIEGVGHMPHVEKSAEVNRLLAAEV